MVDLETTLVLSHNMHYPSGMHRQTTQTALPRDTHPRHMRTVLGKKRSGIRRDIPEQSIYQKLWQALLTIHRLA